MFNFKKLVSLGLALIMVFSLGSTAFAQTTDFKKLPELTEQDIERGIEQALQMKLSKVNNVAERNQLEAGIRANLEEINVSELQTKSNDLKGKISTQGIDFGDIW